MGLFSGLFGKKAALDAPRAGLPWTLTVNARPVSAFTFSDVEKGLRALFPDNDSFVILEQKDPRDANNYWFLQSAIALAGPLQGKYIIGVGYGGEGKRALLERYVPSVDEVIPYFERAFQGRAIDLSVFEDQSDMLF